MSIEDDSSRDDAPTLRARCEHLEREHARLERRVSTLMEGRHRRSWRMQRQAPAIAGALALVVFLTAVAFVGLGRLLFTADRASTIQLAGPVWMAARHWRMTAGTSACPSVERLESEEKLDDSSDEWGRPFQIKCTAEEIVVISAGADGHFGTPDDIQAPKGQ